MDQEKVFQKFFTLGNSYWLTRFVILRLLGFVYAVAFLVAARQLVPLIGEHRLTPANHFLGSIEMQLGSQTAGMLRVPTLFWFGISDSLLAIFSWVGFALSLVVLGGYANAILLAVLWVMYMSIVHIGQIWYGYGWEIELLEVGFVAIFLCPLLDARPFPRRAPPVVSGGRRSTACVSAPISRRGGARLNHGWRIMVDLRALDGLNLQGAYPGVVPPPMIASSVELVHARSFTWPALICEAIDGNAENTSDTSPLSKAGTACAVPLYGTCTMSSPRGAFSASMLR